MAAAVNVSVNIQLKELRKAAVPRLSIRGMAEALGIGYSRYAYFEDPKRFKKRELPLDLTRKIAAVLSRHGVDPSEVMKLAGLSEDEAQPEAREIEAQKPTQFCVTLPVILPSEAALRDMFRSMLVMVPDRATKDEAAEILARRLPSGLAAIGPVLLDPVAAVSIAGEADPQYPAKAHPEAEQRSRT
ncbi:helix-turn-helix transcriptional regulator [Novosphingobium sp. PY1]|uniref:helix-turn-helix domain-containing protein n=1 Tax=Novosphingobium sp. PY1 TaxID=1882221 RepID=UPI001A9020B0|nr:helix-turn-helix transcriptional regulator [Novosphingobium sp. PY1]GFM28127.1 putative uncharacterized protein [Novosphingobium sp. PY1]